MGRPVDVATLIKRIPPSAEGIYSTDVATLMKSQGVDAIVQSGSSLEITHSPIHLTPKYQRQPTAFHHRHRNSRPCKRSTGEVNRTVSGNALIEGSMDSGALVNAASPWTQVLGKYVVQGLSSAVMESAVLGTSLDEAIQNNLQGALINTAGALGANAIGDAASGPNGISETSKAIAHALLGCAIGSATAGNASAGCAPGATGAVVGELVAGWYADSTGYDQLKIDANKPGASEALKQQFAVASNTMAELAKLAGAGGALLVGGDANAMQLAMNTANNAAVNNRQLHVDEVAWIKANAAEFAKTEGISVDAAIARLSQQASKDIDLLMRARLSDGNDAKAQAFLSDVTASFVNDNGTKQTLFTTQGQQLLRPEMFAESVDVKFVQQYVSPGFSRSLSTGLTKEFRDLGIDIGGAVINGAIDMGKAAVNQPVATFNAVLGAVKGLPGAVWDGFTESGRSLGEGAAVMFTPEIQDKLNTLYATDVRSAQILLQTARVVTALGGAAGAGATGKSAAELSEVVGKQVGKKVDEILDQAALNALLKSGGVYDKTGQAILDLKQLSTAQKGMVGELLGADTVKQIVPDGERIARLPGVGETGIDDLYKVNRPDVDYVNIEYKFVGQDSKTGAQALGKTQDGLQGSQTWIAGSGRIEKAVGELAAPAVYKAIDAGRVESWVVTTRSDGSTSIQVLDALGKPKPVDVSKIIVPGLNLSGVQK